MGLLDAIGRGLAYNSDEQKQDRADAREMGNYEKKLKLTNDIAMQLEERKAQLEQKYPQAKQLFATPWGTVLSRSTTGVDIVQENPDIRAAHIAKQEAAGRNAGVAEAMVGPKSALLTAQAEEVSTRSPDRNRAIDVGANSRETVATIGAEGRKDVATTKAETTKPISDSVANTIVKEATAEAMAPYVKENKISKAKDTSEWDMLTPAEQSQKIKAAVDRRTEALKLVTGGTAAAAGMPGVAPATQDLGIFGDIE